jgi:hypothetical protein
MLSKQSQLPWNDHVPNINDSKTGSLPQRNLWQYPCWYPQIVSDDGNVQCRFRIRMEGNNILLPTLKMKEN